MASQSHISNSYFVSPGDRSNRAGGSLLFHIAIDSISFLLMYFVVLTTFFPLETYLSGGDSGEVALPLPVNSLTMVFTTFFALVICVQAARSGKKLHHPYLLYVYVAIAFASVLWGDDTRTTLLRAPRLAMLVLLAVAFASYYDLRKSLRMLVWAFLLSAVTSILVAALVPSLGLSRIGGAYEAAWRGAQSHKNFTGVVYAIGLIVTYYAWRLRSTRRSTAIATLMCCSIMLIMANSFTSIAAAGASLMTAAFLSWLNRVPGNLRFLVGAFCLSLGAAIVLLLIANLDFFFGLAGRDLTFTGRTDIWAAVWDKIMESPILGFGYGFWTGDSRELLRLRTILNFDAAAHAHNMWLDIWLQLGVGAVILAMITFAKLMFGAGRLVISERNIPAALLLSLVLFFFYRSFTEIALTDPYIVGAFWISWCVVWLTRISRERSPRMMPGPNIAAASLRH